MSLHPCTLQWFHYKSTKGGMFPKYAEIKEALVFRDKTSDRYLNLEYHQPQRQISFFLNPFPNILKNMPLRFNWHVTLHLENRVVELVKDNSYNCRTFVMQLVGWHYFTCTSQQCFSIQKMKGYPLHVLLIIFYLSNDSYQHETFDAVSPTISFV